MRVFLLFCLTILTCGVAIAQHRSVSITIDDVPNVNLITERGKSAALLRKLDSLRVPVAIFINEKNLSQTPDSGQNRNLLASWLLKDYITPGNHSYSHPNYGEIGFNAFSEEVIKGEELTKEILKSSGKRLEYFRFPFNGMGKDSLQHIQMQQFLREKGYISTPFTVESEDWLYTQLYEDALKRHDHAAAAAIGQSYVDFSLKLFAHFDSLALVAKKRPVSQIYLCHDNRLNADFLPVLIGKLKAKGYQMVSLKQALTDEVYRSEDYYNGNAGFSWLYRWMKDPAERRAAMRKEPANPEIQAAYEALQKRK